ncbi:MAG TPA: cation:proton antiporter, partial [Pseudonocardiaceae bacterium]|nr:cation:proton antiporter [Pseudonocardiaceae bacterium]
VFFAAPHPASLVRTGVLLVVYVVGAVFVVRPVLRRWLRTELFARQRVPILVGLAFASAWATAGLGLHTIFGAVLLGVLTPRGSDGSPREDLLQPIERAGAVLLPVFFVTAGLSVDIGSLRGSDYLLLAVVLVVAMAGKLLGAGAGARAAGLGWRDSTAVAALMNTRGLTELIALSVGKQVGLLDSRLYAVLVLMALITTVTTAPLLTALGFRPTRGSGLVEVDLSVAKS